MTLLGFNATAVAAGMTTRGQSWRTGKRPYALMDLQTLAETICKSTAEELERLFNGTIACLSRFGLIAAEVTVAVDGTPCQFAHVTGSRTHLVKYWPLSG